MMQNRSHIILHRLVIVSQMGTIAFDESFHTGVNIIRGKNSSGKSTISNFIFYVLGGDFTEWSTAALKCREVFAEVNINNVILTIKRQVTQLGQQPMSIFWGNFDNAASDSINWQTYPYKQTEGKINFTKVIFNTLAFPEVRTDSDNNITIHQILRLLYIDQDTSTQSLFRAERFDPPLTRQTIAEVLLGIFDDSLYKDRLQVKALQKELDDKKNQYEGIIKIYGSSGLATKVGNIHQEINQNTDKIQNLEKEISLLYKEPLVKTTKNSTLEIEKIQMKLSPLKNEISYLTDKLRLIDLDIYDSKKFINTLEKRVDDLNSSLLTRKLLGELPLSICPQCLSPLESHNHEGNCFLCKQPIEAEERTQAQRLRQEMEIQIKESKSLLKDKEIDVVELRTGLINKTEEARKLQKELDLAVKESKSTRDQRIDHLLIEKGGLERNLEFLNQQLQIAELLISLKRELEELSSKISSTNRDIIAKEGLQLKRRNLALHTIKRYTLDIIRKDLMRQDEFRTGTSVEVMFTKDTYSLDGTNNFSASSKILLKNAILFSIFFASLELDFMRYPRFILCDNMEDKGMEKERTQNFQKIISDISSTFKVDHQIIFTTSMINDQLNNTNLCIGIEYDQNNKTLKI